ncbi:hypothetical protein M8J76_014885 [Diaphorina citri]|nr:hypothetical protein M8J76_014885 [Diaphorina citri]
MKKCCPIHQQLYLDDSDNLRCLNVTRNDTLDDETFETNETLSEEPIKNGANETLDHYNDTTADNKTVVDHNNDISDVNKSVIENVISKLKVGENLKRIHADSSEIEVIAGKLENLNVCPDKPQENLVKCAEEGTKMKDRDIELKDQDSQMKDQRDIDDDDDDDVWWIPDDLNFVQIQNKQVKIIEHIRLTGNNFIADEPIACFDQEPEFLLIKPNLFIDIDTSNLVLSDLEKVPEYTVETLKETLEENGPGRNKRNVDEIPQKKEKWDRTLNNKYEWDGENDDKEESKKAIEKNKSNIKSKDEFEGENDDKEESKKAIEKNKSNIKNRNEWDGENHDKEGSKMKEVDKRKSKKETEKRTKRTVRKRGLPLKDEIDIVRDPKDGTKGMNVKKINGRFGRDVYCIDRVGFKTDEEYEQETSRLEERNTTQDKMEETKVEEETEEAFDWSYVILLCPCLNQATSDTVCVRKCCPERHLLHVLKDEDRSAQCVAQDGPHGPKTQPELGEEIFTSDNQSQRLSEIPHYIIHGTPKCRAGSYLLRNNTAHRHYRILRNSSVLLTASRSLIPASQYCVDSIYYTASDRLVPANILLCRREDAPDSTRRLLYTIFFIVGTTFLVLTLGVYAALPELRKSVHSWNIMAHIACSVVANVAIVVANLYSITYPTMCVLMDIAFTFSGLRAPGGRNFSDVDKRKFLYYSCYTWGTTVLISALTCVMDETHLLAANSTLKPNFGVRACWFKDSAALAVFFYGPIGLLLVANLVLFHYTCWKIRAAQKDTAITSAHRHKDTAITSAHRHVGGRTKDQTRLTTFIKLFLLMGVTWTFEIISWLLGGPGYLWYLTDILNVLRGLFIFLILCVKRNVYTGLAKKLRRSRLPGASSRPRASSTNSRRHSKSSITTEHVALSRLNLAGNCQARIVEEEEGVRGEERGEPPPLAHAPGLSAVVEENGGKGEVM